MTTVDCWTRVADLEILAAITLPVRVVLDPDGEPVAIHAGAPSEALPLPL